MERREQQGAYRTERGSAQNSITVTLESRPEMKRRWMNGYSLLVAVMLVALCSGCGSELDAMEPETEDVEPDPLQEGPQDPTPTTKEDPEPVPSPPSLREYLCSYDMDGCEVEAVPGEGVALPLKPAGKMGLHLQGPGVWEISAWATDAGDCDRWTFFEIDGELQYSNYAHAAGPGWTTSQTSLAIELTADENLWLSVAGVIDGNCADPTSFMGRRVQVLRWDTE